MTYTFGSGPGPSDYQAVAVSQTDLLVQGNTATAQAQGAGSYINHFVISVATSASSTVSIKDGSTGSAIVIMAATTAIGTYYVPWKTVAKSMTANKGWYITTGAGATVVVVGNFLGAI